MGGDFYPVIQSEIASRLRLVKAISTLFVSVADVKAQLRYTGSDEDGFIEGLIAAATTLVEKMTGRCFRQNRFIYTLDRFPVYYRYGSDKIVLPYGPVIAVESLTYLDGDGVRQTLDTDDYAAEIGVDHGRITPADVWPDCSIEPGSVAITYTAGCPTNASGGGSEPDFVNTDAIPDPIKVAVTMLAAHWHRNRVPVAIGVSAQELPYAIDTLCQPYKVGGV